MSVFKILSTLLHFPKINIINFVSQYSFFLFIKIKVNDIYRYFKEYQWMKRITFHEFYKIPREISEKIKKERKKR